MLAPARGDHFFRKLRSRAELARIYAERGGASQLAETCARVRPADREPPIWLCTVRIRSMEATFL